MFLGVLIELHLYSEAELVIPKCAQCFKVKLVPISNNHFALR